jgi:hypothetical protein
MTSTSAPSARRLARDERGMALVLALMTLLLITALGIGVLVTSTGETVISTNFRDSNEARYGADAGIERVMQDLLSVPDWNTILQGATQSPFIDGPPSGTRALPGGGTLDLVQATNMVNCGKPTTCSDADMNAYTWERPWGINNPRWALFAYGPAADIIETATVNSPFYIVVWVGDDPSETDNNPRVDGGPFVPPATANAGAGIISLRAVAFGPGGTQQVIETTVARTDTTEIERGYTGQRGQDEQNRRARKAAVQTPGKALTRSQMGTSTGGFTVQ